MRILNVIFIMLFLLSAGLQYNDPDPYLWIAIYMYGAFICYHALRQKCIPSLYIIGWIVYGTYAAYLFFSADGVLSWWQQHKAENIAQSMKATKPWIEATREFFGLLILIFALVINWAWLHKRQIKRGNRLALP